MDDSTAVFDLSQTSTEIWNSNQTANRVIIALGIALLCLVAAGLLLIHFWVVNPSNYRQAYLLLGAGLALPCALVWLLVFFNVYSRPSRLEVTPMGAEIRFTSGFVRRPRWKNSLLRQSVQVWDLRQESSSPAPFLAVWGMGPSVYLSQEAAEAVMRMARASGLVESDIPEVGISKKARLHSFSRSG